MTLSSSALRTRDLPRSGAFRLGMALLAVVALTVALPSPGLAVNTGILTQPASPDGCASDDGTGGDCATVDKLVGAQGVAVSPDNKHVYVTAFSDDSIIAFSRDKSTSVLTKIDCYTNNTTAGCTTIKPLTQPYGIAVSPDGKFVYVTSQGSNAVVVLARNKKTGTLTKSSCVAKGNTGGCTNPVTPLNHPQGLDISKDGKFVVVAVRVDDAVISFTRDKKTGALSKVNCVSDAAISAGCTVGVALKEPRDVAISQDSKHVYVASKVSNAVAAFSLDKKSGAITQLQQLAGANPTDGCVSSDGTGGSCETGDGLTAPVGVTSSPDGKHVYVTSIGAGASAAGSAVAMFSRDKKTGVITQLGCIDDGTNGACDTGTALNGATGVAVTQDGKHVYVAANVSDAVSVFSRDKNTGLLTQLSPTDGCVSADGTGGDCAIGIALNGAVGVAVAKDGNSVYVTATDSDAVAAFSRD